MSKSLGWRAAIVAIVVLLSFIYLMPSLTSVIPGWWSNILPRDKIHLGLDLQGGMHLVLEVGSVKAVESHLERVVEEIKRDLRKSKIRYVELKRLGNDRITLTLMGPEDKDVFNKMVDADYPDFEAVSVPGEGDRPSFELTLLPKAKTHIMKMAVDQALETIRNRIDQFGVSEPDIRPQQDNRILVQLPGIKDAKRAVDLIGKTALLEFKLVDEEHGVEEALKGNIPPGDEILYQVNIDPQTGRETKIPFLL